MPQLIHYTETDSTNSLLKELSRTQTIEDQTVIFTDFQTSGRGQRGNTWESDKGKNILFSMLISPNMVKASEPFIISQITSLAIKEVLSYYTNDITIKWPNDIYWKDQKICGILIENNICDDYISQSFLGCGININQTAFRSDAPNPISLTQITGKHYDIQLVLNQIINRISYYYISLGENHIQTIVENYKLSLYRRDGFHLFSDAQEIFSAKIYDVANTGHLILETEQGKLRKFAFKEITYIL